MELIDTVDLMLSEDYDDRLIAQIRQLQIRLERINALLKCWNRLLFEPKCGKLLIIKQRDAMQQYLDILIERARIQNVLAEVEGYETGKD